jgi:V8-like Glu-specific endopeptidase
MNERNSNGNISETDSGPRNNGREFGRIGSAGRKSDRTNDKRAKRAAQRVITAMLALWSILLVIAMPQSAEAETGKKQQPIVGGSKASVDEYPFIVALSIQIGSNGYSCGGSLVDPSFVLTAAHCVREGSATAKPSGITAVIGRTDLTDGSKGEMRGVSQVIVHPRYGKDVGSWSNDLAVLRLSKASKFKPIRLASPWAPDDRYYWMGGRTATVIGYGKTCGGKCDGSSWLLEAELPVWSDGAGEEWDDSNEGNFNGDIHVAAGGKGKSSCQGDSGGPLFSQTAEGGRKQFGVVSWGTEGCPTDRPSIFAEIGRYNHNWIQTIIRETPRVGDFNGDGRDDIVAFTHWNHDVYVSLSNGSSFSAPMKWHDTFGNLGEQVAVGDVDGDGKDDIWTFADTQVWISRSAGDRFSPDTITAKIPTRGREVLVGDVSGDAKDDLVVVHPHVADTFRSAGTKLVHTGAFTFGGSERGTHALADVDQDLKADLVDFKQDGSGDTVVRRSTGSSFVSGKKWHDWFGTPGEQPMTAKLNGDHKDDLVLFTSSMTHHDVWTSISSGSAFLSSQRWHDSMGGWPDTTGLTGDFNRDGYDDIAQFEHEGRGSRVLVAMNNGLAFAGKGTFGPPKVWSSYFAP